MASLPSIELTLVPMFAKVLVTGVSGFIGHHLAVALLELGLEVAVIVRPDTDPQRIPAGVAVFHYDGSTARMIHILSEAQPDTVFHLASCFLARHTSDDLDRLVDSNLRFGLQLLEAMAVTGCHRLINTGTGWQHFENRDYDPVCLYAATKQAFEALIEHYVQVNSLVAITLELNDTYGSGDPRGKLISLLVDAARTGKPLDLSPGEQQVDLVHVDDVVAAFLCAQRSFVSQQTPGHARFMVSSGKPLTVRELVTVIDNITGKPIQANWGKRPYRQREVMVPWNEGNTVPGWSPVVALKEGISRLWSGSYVWAGI
jgi:nucleoside-diphosphate-sugar epimerase